MIMFMSFLELCRATIWIDDPSLLWVGGGICFLLAFCMHVGTDLKKRQ